MTSMLVPLQSPSALREERRARRERWGHLRPEVATVVIENRCHLKCDHCYEDEESHPRRYDALSVDEYAVLFEDLAALGVIKLTITGGEVFLRKDLFEILEEAAKRRFYVELYTSGTLIDDDKARRLATLVHEVHISVYAPFAELHDKFTKRPGSFDKSVQAMKLCKAHGLDVQMKSNIMTFNVDLLDDMMDMADAFGVRYSFDPSVRARMSGDEAPLQYQVSKTELATKVYNKPRLVAHFRQKTAESLCKGDSVITGDDNVICSAATSGLSIGAEGQVSGCNFFASNVGTIRERPLRELWLESDDFDAIRKARMSNLQKCGNCDVRSTCHPCMAQAEIDEGDMMGCNHTSRITAEGLHDMAERKARANRKMKSSKGLPIVGDTHFIPRDPGGILSFE